VPGVQDILRAITLISDGNQNRFVVLSLPRNVSLSHLRRGCPGYFLNRLWNLTLRWTELKLPGFIIIFLIHMRWVGLRLFLQSVVGGNRGEDATMIFLSVIFVPG
jgi:hypothetical protein